MEKTEVITVFSNEALAINASAESSMISLRKLGPNTLFWGDFRASNPGRFSVRYKVADSPSDTFYTPTNASLCCASFLGGSTASRDRFALSIMGAEWIKFKVKENNASHGVFSMGLIVSKG